jgi:hypothetical protein
MRKSQSLIALDMMELNVLDFYITKDKREATHYLAKHMGKRKSMRTERGDEFLCPFYYWQTTEELLPKALQLIDEGYTLIFCDSLDGNDTVMFGALALTGTTYEDDHIDFVIGPGKLRELDTHPGKISFSIPSGTLIPFKDFAPYSVELHHLYYQVRDKCIEHVPCVVEWSLYPYPTGRRGDKFVFWELRGY